MNQNRTARIVELFKEYFNLWESEARSECDTWFAKQVTLLGDSVIRRMMRSPKEICTYEFWDEVDVHTMTYEWIVMTLSGNLDEKTLRSDPKADRFFRITDRILEEERNV